MTPEEFGHRLEPYRRELLAHCYRMLGSVDDAEDAVQETNLRAWRSHGTFDGRSSLRVWLYRIATNACLTAVERRRAVTRSVPWLQPMPDALVTGEAPDPATVAAGRESLRLALVASLQYLPPRQRAVLILREVLDFPAAEVAAMLDTTTAAVKSTLQRARVRLDEVAPQPEHQLSDPTDPRARALLQDYIDGFENYDMAALERALRADAAIELVGTTTWFSGRDRCLPFLSGVIAAPGRWTMIPTIANGLPAAAAYERDAAGVHRAYGLGVLTVTEAGILRISVFGGGADLVARFGLPPTVTAPVQLDGGGRRPT